MVDVAFVGTGGVVLRDGSARRGVCRVSERPARARVVVRAVVEPNKETETKPKEVEVAPSEEVLEGMPKEVSLRLCLHEEGLPTTD